VVLGLYLDTNWTPLGYVLVTVALVGSSDVVGGSITVGVTYGESTLPSPRRRGVVIVGFVVGSGLRVVGPLVIGVSYRAESA